MVVIKVARIHIRNVRQSSKTGRKRRTLRKKYKSQTENTKILSRLETLALEVQSLKSEIGVLQSSSKELFDTDQSFGAHLADVRDYFGKKIRDVTDNSEDLYSRIEEMQTTLDRLARDLDKLFESPIPVTSQLTIYRGEEDLSFKVGVIPGIIETVMEHARACVDQKDKHDEEIVGVLTGRVAGNTVIIEEAVPGRASYSGMTEVALDPNNLAEIVDNIIRNDKNQRIVGWYHSHLGLGVFLSDIDVKTQLTLQQFSYVIALVVDPIKNEYSFFYVDKEVKEPDGRPKTIKFVKSE
jgi:proteasome lid subunit RPN8/RPN11